MYLKLSDFTKTPGGRYRNDGPFSAEEWRDDYLVPAAKIGPIVVDLDGTAGIASSFIEEAFGGLMRINKEFLVSVVSNESQYYMEEAKASISEELGE